MRQIIIKIHIDSDSDSVIILIDVTGKALDDDELTGMAINCVCTIHMHSHLIGRESASVCSGGDEDNVGGACVRAHISECNHSHSR